MGVLRVLAIVLVSLGVAIAIALVAWTLSRGHVIFFPLIVLFGVPFIPWLARKGR